MTDKTDAIVIRQADFSESSRVVTFFTREFGKLAMLAKGGRRAKNPFDSALDLLAESSLVFIRKQNALSLLTEASLRSRFRPPASDVAALYAGYYVAELLDGLTEDADPHVELYDAAVAALTSLANGENRFLTVTRFELRLLTEIGQFPSFDECLKCGREVSDVAASHYVHWVSQGGVLCEQCRVDSYASTRLSPGAFAVLKRLLADDNSAVAAAPPPKQHVGEIRSVMNQVVAYCLERKPKTARYLMF